MTISPDLDIANADSPEAFYAALMANARAASDDAAASESTAFLSGTEWSIAADVLETAAESFKRRVIKSGYPWRD